MWDFGSLEALCGLGFWAERSGEIDLAGVRCDVIENLLLCRDAVSFILYLCSSSGSVYLALCRDILTVDENIFL